MCIGLGIAVSGVVLWRPHRTLMRSEQQVSAEGNLGFQVRRLEPRSRGVARQHLGGIRAKAAELLALIDRHYPAAPQRPALHAMLSQAYQAYGDNAAAIREGTAFLADFPHAPQRVEVALETADAYSRNGETTQEFAISGSAERTGRPRTSPRSPSKSATMAPQSPRWCATYGAGRP